jgi:hypothetical protein
MFKFRFRLPSPALVISLIALSLVLGGTAVAAGTAKHKDAKADTKLVRKLAPSLSVKHAKTANSATTAASATHATSADSATNATHATSADSATNATNATNATTAANANALGGVAASSYVQNSGTVYVQVGYANWEVFDTTDPMEVIHFTDTTGFVRTATGSNFLRIDATLPAALYGKALSFVGFQMCYGTNTGNSITQVNVEKDTQTSLGNGGVTAIVTDNTARTDAACRTYSPASPVPMTSSTQFGLFVIANWTTANTDLFLGRVTAILQPTATAATASHAASARGNSSLGASAGQSH